MDEQRLIALEMKLSHQELAIETLQEMLYEQHQELRSLKEAMRQQSRRFERLVDGGLDIGPANEQPPHY